MSCSGDTLTDCAHQVDGDEMSGGERCQCRTAVFVTYSRHSCIRNVRNTLQGGSLPGTEQLARMFMLRPEGGTGGGRDGWRQTDGGTVTKAGAMGWEGGNQAKQEFLFQSVRHCSEV